MREVCVRVSPQEDSVSEAPVVPPSRPLLICRLSGLRTPLLPARRKGSKGINLLVKGYISHIVKSKDTTEGLGLLIYLPEC